MTRLRLGTRGSALALWQARTVAAALEARGSAVEIVTIATGGDRRQDVALPEIGGKGVFVKEIEDALLSGDIDLAVHSAKDMAAERTAGLAIAATLSREDARDALVAAATGAGARFSDPAGLEHRDLTAVFGTGSARRVAQLRRAYPGATFTPVRGNVDTRLRKLDAGDMDVLVLAAAGLKRLGFGNRITALIPVLTCVPAPGQGIVAIEVRADAEQTYALVAAITDERAATALRAEQAVVAALGGGCQLPLGAFASIVDDLLLVRAVVASTDGDELLVAEATGRPMEAEAVGREAALDLEALGARRILQA